MSENVETTQEKPMKKLEDLTVVELKSILYDHFITLDKTQQTIKILQDRLNVLINQS